MQSQVGPAAQAPRLDTRSLIAAGLCVMALFFDWLGWALAIAGIVLLRKAAFSRRAKLLLATVALAPKILFIGVRSLNAPQGLSFPIEPRNLATSSSLWTWSIFLVAFGLFLLFMPQRAPQDPAVLQRSRRSPLLVALGLAAIAAAAVILLGLIDGFHRIDDAGGGRWALRHAARGNRAVFGAGEVASIYAEERYSSRGGTSYSIRVALAGGRSYSVTTKSSAALDELQKFAATAGLPAGKVRIDRRFTRWTNGASGFTLKDCVGAYEQAEASGGSRSTYEFWLDNGRLAGKETVAGPEGRRVRVLRNIKVSDNGAFEFDSGGYAEASQQGDGKMAFSLRFSAGGETGRFAGNGLEVGLQKYRKR